MTHRPTLRRTAAVLLLGAVLPLAAACSSSSSGGAGASATFDPTSGRDVCSIVPTHDFAAFTDAAAPSKSSSGLTQGLQGGNCKMEFRGANGTVEVETFLALQPTGEAAARKMYDEFKQDASSRTDGQTTVSAVKGLGSEAVLMHDHDDSRPWQATDVTLYKYVVRRGALVLTFTVSGYALDASTWPSTEQDYRDKLTAIARELLGSVAG